MATYQVVTMMLRSEGGQREPSEWNFEELLDSRVALLGWGEARDHPVDALDEAAGVYAAQEGDAAHVRDVFDVQQVKELSVDA